MAGGGKGGRSGGRERKLSAKGLRIARRMRLQVPLPPEPKWKRKRTAAAMQAAIAEWKLERKPAPPAAKPQRKPGTAARPPRRRRSRATSISSRAGRRRDRPPSSGPSPVFDRSAQGGEERGDLRPGSRRAHRCCDRCTSARRAATAWRRRGGWRGSGRQRRPRRRGSGRRRRGGELEGPARRPPSAPPSSDGPPVSGRAFTLAGWVAQTEVVLAGVRVAIVPITGFPGSFFRGLWLL